MDYLQQLRAIVGSRQLITVGAGVVVLRGKAVLLELRRDSRDWALPGGAKELGESLEDTARRELLEETGLVARKLRFLTLCSGPEFAYTYPNGDRVDRVAALYQALEVEGDLRRNECESLGGSTVMEPVDVPEGPTIAMFTDPEGHLVGLVKE